MTPTDPWDELEALARAAAPGPCWPRWGGEPGYVYSPSADKVVAEVPHEKSDAVERNASRFIAACDRDRILALLAERRRLEADRDRLAAAVRELLASPRYGDTPSEDAVEEARAALASIEAPAPCDHEWIDMRNEVIESGEWCRKCNAIRAPDTGTARGG